MRLSSLRRILTTLGVVALTGPVAGCSSGALSAFAAGLDQAAGTQYYDFSEAHDSRMSCSDGSASPGYYRVYHGIASNNRYLYMYNASRVPVTFAVTWSDGSTFSDEVAPGTYSTRTERWATITARSRSSWYCN